MRLFTYCLLYDTGAAPNPYFGVCTLVICKPAIRRNAKIGDWVVGHGSKGRGDAGKVIYAMEVTKKMTMEEYNKYCLDKLPGKIPDWSSNDYSRRVGDCLYDFSHDDTDEMQVKMREGVHCGEDKEYDLEGKYALLSDHFYYFGKNSIALPESLYPIIHSSPGHKSNSNAPFIDEFIKWIKGLDEPRNTVLGDPNDSIDEACNNTCSG